MNQKQFYRKSSKEKRKKEKQSTVSPKVYDMLLRKISVLAKGMYSNSCKNDGRFPHKFSQEVLRNKTYTFFLLF